MINLNKTYMNKIILRKDKISKNQYFFIDKSSEISKFSEKLIFHINFWTENKKTLKRKKKIGIILDSNQSLDLIKDDIELFNLVQFNFLTFKDGRPFTEGKKLRKFWGFAGEIRASGHILPDQYVFLNRCGFDSFEIDEGKEKFWIEFFNMDKGLYYQP